MLRLVVHSKSSRIEPSGIWAYGNSESAATQHRPLYSHPCILSRDEHLLRKDRATCCSTWKVYSAGLISIRQEIKRGVIIRNWIIGSSIACMSFTSFTSFT